MTVLSWTVSFLLAAVKLALLGVTIWLDQQHRRSLTNGNLRAEIPPPLTPFTAAATLIALGLTLYSSNYIHPERSIDFAGTGCKPEPQLAGPPDAVADQSVIATVSGLSTCKLDSLTLYVDGVSVPSTVTTSSAQYFFINALARGSHAYLFVVGTSNANTALRGTIEAKNPLAFTDLKDSITTLGASVTAIAGLIAAVLAIFKRSLWQ